MTKADTEYFECMMARWATELTELEEWLDTNRNIAGTLGYATTQATKQKLAMCLTEASVVCFGAENHITAIF